MHREARPAPVPCHLYSSDNFLNYVFERIHEKEKSKGKKREGERENDGRTERKKTLGKNKRKMRQEYQTGLQSTFWSTSFGINGLAAWEIKQIGEWGAEPL